jgi:hypothetical protein
MNVTIMNPRAPRNLSAAGNAGLGSVTLRRGAGNLPESVSASIVLPAAAFLG